VRTIIAAIIKFLSWALFIIVALLYMDNFDVKSKALVLLGGIVIIDIIVGAAKHIAHFSAKQRKRRIEKKLKEQSEALKHAAAEKASAAAEAVKNTGAAVRDGAAGAASRLWDGVQHIGTSIRNSLAAVDEADSEAIPMLGDGSRRRNTNEQE